MTIKGKVFASREKGKNGRYPYHPFEDSKQEVKNKNFSEGNDVSPKERHISPRGRSLNDPGKRKMPPRFVISPSVSPG